MLFSMLNISNIDVSGLDELKVEFHNLPQMPDGTVNIEKILTRIDALVEKGRVTNSLVLTFKQIFSSRAFAFQDFFNIVHESKLPPFQTEDVELIAKAIHLQGTVKVFIFFWEGEGGVDIHVFFRLSKHHSVEERFMKFNVQI
jgi:hypothetical protein